MVRRTGAGAEASNLSTVTCPSGLHPQGDGKTQRPLGIPAIRDRKLQMAAVLVLEPIFEADLQPEQYAYRKDRSALDAVRHVQHGSHHCWT